MTYAYSLKTERVKEKDFPYSGEQLTCTAELVNFVHKLQDSDVEKMVVIYLDERWSGFLGQETGIYKWEAALGSCSCRSLFLR
jgi:hypothetical protein